MGVRVCIIVFVAIVIILLVIILRMRMSVMEFMPLYDIPYIFLSLDTHPYLSIDKFLTSPDWYWNLSMFIPNASFP